MAKLIIKRKVNVQIGVYMYQETSTNLQVLKKKTGKQTHTYNYILLLLNNLTIN